MQIRIEQNTLHIGPVQVTFQRTLRIPDDGHTYPLPPGLGAFPIRRVADYADRVPDDWRRHGGVLLPMYQREAMWLSFGGRWWKPNALKVAVGKVDAISGEDWSETLHADEQDYLVIPTQPWLDGINSGKGTIRQFVAMPLGMGYTVEAQVTGKEEHGGLQLCVFDPKAGRFPDEPPTYPVTRDNRLAGGGPPGAFAQPSAAAAAPMAPAQAEGAAMGLGAGGTMSQDIHPDPHGIDTWDQSDFARVFVHLCNAQLWREITGEEPPATPVSAKSYAQYGLPWFERYDDHLGDVKPADKLSQVKSVKQMDQQKGFAPQQDDSTVDTPNVVHLEVDDPSAVKDGNW